jgi:pullulanase/glycogen debranching enzyme
MGSTTKPIGKRIATARTTIAAGICGVEGPSNDPAIEKLRNQQSKNMLAIVLLSAGTPMIMMGDEVHRTQLGNNNAYCQDNVLTWLDWSLLEKARGPASLREPSGPISRELRTLSRDGSFQPG